jgi:hypothetical protein
MNGFFVLLALMLLPPSPIPELPRDSLPLDDTKVTRAVDQAFKKLSLPCPDRGHINDLGSGGEGSRFFYRAGDMYDDCADEIDAIVKSKANR